MAAKSTSSTKLPISMEDVGASLPVVVPRAAAHKPIPRPDGGGTRGRPIALRANFFRMTLDRNVTIQHYDVKIVPEIKSKPKLREIVKVFVEKNRQTIFRNVYPVYDGAKNLFTHCLLTSGIEKFEDSIHLPGDVKESPITIAIQHVASISLSNLMDFLNGSKKDVPQDAIQALDIVLRHSPTNLFLTVGPYIFTHPAGVEFWPGLELWKGYFSSTRPAWKVNLVNVDSSVRIFHKGQHVIDLLCEVIGVEQLQDRPLNPRPQFEFEKHIRGLRVEVDVHTFPNLCKCTYKIIGLSEDSAKKQTFQWAQPDGTEKTCTVAQYYKEKYDIKLRYQNLPCLQAQPKEKHRYLPLEICVVKKGQQLSTISDELKAKLITYSAVPAPTRQREINGIVQNANLGNDEFSRAFGLQVSTTMTQLTGRVLAPPAIEYKAAKTVNVIKGVWNLMGAKFYSGAAAAGITVMCLERMSENTIWKFVRGLSEAAQNLGMLLPMPKKIDYPRDFEDISRQMRDARRRERPLLLIIVILPRLDSGPIYAEIKRLGDLHLGVATQCVKPRIVERPNIQIYSNLCQKINAKLGETNGIIYQPQFSRVFAEPAIIMGADVTHPSPNEMTKPSIAAVTGSHDDKAFKYTAHIRMQKHREEMIADLKDITVSLLRNFRKKTSCIPRKIIFYRDGVSEGQFSQVLACELKAIQQACTSLDPNYKPGITYIVVQKRHHARLFCRNPNDEVGTSRNIPAGTTVDTVIVHPVEFDFYLCSHQGIQGTSKPAHYYVLYDDNDYSSDVIQELSYQLCHVYARCTRSVSIPAPVYYAHHCAFRGRYYYDSLREEGLVPEGPIVDPEILRHLNENCTINEAYQGMFFA